MEKRIGCKQEDGVVGSNLCVGKKSWEKGEEDDVHSVYRGEMKWVNRSILA